MCREYEVRRYPAFGAVETSYETRPEGYDRLGTYVGGWNEEVRGYLRLVWEVELTDRGQGR